MNWLNGVFNGLGEVWAHGDHARRLREPGADRRRAGERGGGDRTTTADEPHADTVTHDLDPPLHVHRSGVPLLAPWRPTLCCMSRPSLFVAGQNKSFG